MRTPRHSPRSVVAAAIVAVAWAAARASEAQGPNTHQPAAIQQEQQLRFPQSVRVGTLCTWSVIAPGGRYQKLGVVVGVFQPKDDDPVLVFRYGGFLGRGGRMIAPSLQDVSLVGAMVKIADLSRSELDKMPTFRPENGAFLGPNDTVMIGVDKKY
jgi:hypothetical protein